MSKTAEEQSPEQHQPSMVYCKEVGVKRPHFFPLLFVFSDSAQ